MELGARRAGVKSVDHCALPVTSWSARLFPVAVPFSGTPEDRDKVCQPRADIRLINLKGA